MTEPTHIAEMENELVDLLTDRNDLGNTAQQQAELDQLCEEHDTWMETEG